MASEPIERLASESEAARARVASTLDEIQNRLDPRRIVEEAVERATGNGLQAIGVVRDAARAHPVAIAAAAAAIGLALLARSHLGKAEIDLGDDLADYTDFDDDFDETPASPRGDDFNYKPSDAAARVLAARAGETVESNPLVSILLGLAAGAALGALFPATDAERRVLGETSDKLGAAARAAGRRAANEFDSAGLSIGKVRARANEAKNQAGRAARSVAAAARDGFKR